MATTTTYSTQLALYNGSAWDASGAAQGKYTTGVRVGIFKLNGSNLRGKIINWVKLTVTSSTAGNSSSKTAEFYRSAYQSINTSVTGLEHITGSKIGTASGTFYNNTLTISANFLGTPLSSGETTFGLYVNEALQSGVNWSKNYFKWTTVSVQVNWDNPPAPTFNGTVAPAYGSLTYFYNAIPTISWTPGTNVDYYVIERAMAPDAHLDIFYEVGQVTGTSFTDDGTLLAMMEQGDFVRFRIKAVGFDGTSTGYKFSGNMRRMLPDEPPTIASGVVTKNKVALTINGETAPIANYKVEYSVDGTNYSEVGTTSTLNINHDTSALIGGSKVKYRVRLEQRLQSENVSINSAYSTPTEIKISGGMSILANGSVRRGRVYKKTSNGYTAIKKVYVKTLNGWREST